MKRARANTVTPALIAAIEFCFLAAGPSPAAAAPPAATLTRWDTQPVIGNDPTVTRLDVDGVTGIIDTSDGARACVTGYGNMFGGGHRPCGMLYWNPDPDPSGNVFCWFGWTGGPHRGDVRIVPAAGMTEVNVTTGFPDRTFGPGDVWMVVYASQIAVHFHLTGSGACNLTDPLDAAEMRIYTNLYPHAAAVDPASYDVWITSRDGLERLDPATSATALWSVPGGGDLGQIEVGPDGMVWFTALAPDRVVRFDPGSDTFTSWAIPGGGLGYLGDIANGIEINPEGLVTFAETVSGEVGILDPESGSLCEVGGGGEVRWIATGGRRSDGEFQVYASEGASNAITVITDSLLGADCQTCTVVDPTSTIVLPTTFPGEFVEFAVVPTRAVIAPTTHVLLPASCGDEGDIVCDTDKRVTAVMRYDTSAYDSGPGALTPLAFRTDGTKALYGSFQGSYSLFAFQSCALGVSLCGNGVLDAGEACDDGNTVGGDGCSPECVLEACVVSGLSRIEGLSAVKFGSGLRFSWSRDPRAPWYHLNSVELKGGLADPRRSPPGSALAECDAAAPATECVDPDALDGSHPLLYYRVLSACGSDGDDEGPF